MIVDVVMPKLGESITEGTIIEWRKKVGDTIKKDEILLEIGTDKVDSEIPSPASGVVVEILAKRNEVVPVDREIARINTEGSGAAEGPPPQKEGEVEEAPPEAAAVEEKRPPEGLVPEPPGEPAVKPQEKVEPAKKRSFYTPLVRSIARREGIGDAELAAIHGTGKGGRVTKIDVLTYLEKRPVVPEAATPAAVAPVAEEIAVPGVAAEEETVEMDRVRQIIARHMRTSLDTAAHVHLVSECDVTGIVNAVKSLQSDFSSREGFKLTYTPFFVLAVVKAIHDFPVFNASLDGSTITTHKNINVGLAVATARGLMVPVIQRCEELNFLGICRKVHDLAVRTRGGKILPEQLQGSTISITNYGIFGNLMGTPIINQPNVAIVGIGAIRKRPVVRETEAGDAIVIRSMTYLSLGFDHRLIDGAGGGRFLQRVVEYLENLDTSSLF